MPTPTPAPNDSPLPVSNPHGGGSAPWLQVSEAELKLIRRLRTLSPGAHLCIIQMDGSGPLFLTILNSGKVERLGKAK